MASLNGTEPNLTKSLPCVSFVLQNVLKRQLGFMEVIRFLFAELDPQNGTQALNETSIDRYAQELRWRQRCFNATYPHNQKGSTNQNII